jgi:hypothetical protein
MARSRSARDPIDQYLAEIRAIPPISAGEEQSLLKAARTGDAAAAPVALAESSNGPDSAVPG